MQPQLPEGLQRYFAAQNALDADAMVACFAPDASVQDESRDYLGHDAIRAWKRETIAKYAVRVEPLGVSEKSGTIVAVVKVSGNFPGSPANLTYSFGLDDNGLIRALEIH